MRDPAVGEEDELEAWRVAALDDRSSLPAVLGIAVALDAWLVLDLSEHRGHLGPLMAAALLRTRAGSDHLPALALGLRRSGGGWTRFRPGVERLAWHLRDGGRAQHGGRDLDKLTGRELMLRRCAGKRKTSRLPQLVELLSRPLSSRSPPRPRQ